MERHFETGKHKEVVRSCSNSECGIAYVAQMGGQKSGSSPVVHIKKVGEAPLGYCSIRCAYSANRWDMTPLKEHYLSLGLDFDEIFPPGYLGPGRRLNGGGDT